MRRFVMAMVLAGIAQGAEAGSWLDVPILRGDIADVPVARQVIWQGPYVGGQASYGSANMDSASGTSDLVAFLLRNTTIENEFAVSQWQLMGQKATSNSGFGGFAGYNWQWGEAVLGLEANYLHSEFAAGISDSMTRMFTTSDGYLNTVTVDSTAAMTVKDILSFRARAAWATGDYLPYAFGGVAIGRADLIRSATVTADGTYVGSASPPPPPYSYAITASDSQINRIIYGYAAGLGLDFMLFGGVFARVEWEHTRFASPVDVQINTVRGALGMRF
ncbi:MAG: porin family protein [Xanthobacteraceae bacterium]|nr:MAG: porin family protein [Xanthobacteraceae bacterium]